MAPKTALVSGTNSGIGLALSVQLCQAGYTTYASVRSLSKADDLKAAAEAAGVADRLHCIEMDVTDDASVTAAVKGVLSETGGAVDVLVANAGYGDFTPPEAAGVANFAENLNVNLYGVVRLVNAVLPGMRAAGAGRIVVTSSTVGLVALPMIPVYCTTKFAVEGFVESMAATYAPVGIHFSLVEPGPVGTPFSANAHAAAADAPAELAGVAAAFAKNSGDFMSAPQDAAECATYHMKAITDAKPQLRYMTYEGLRWMVGAKFVDLTGTKTMEALATLTTPREESS